jgi:hypothetical protein
MSYYVNDSDLVCGCYVALPLPWCCESIKIPQLNTGATFKAVITDHFNIQYEQDSIAIVDGYATIDVTELPMGFFNPYSGSYKLQVFNELDLVTPVNFVFGANSYDCIQLTFKEIIPVPTTAEIQ